MKKIAPYLLFIFSAGFLYLFSLNKVPVHLNQDELMFSLNAKSIAESGTDYYGNNLPFYFWHLGSFWATPVTVYVASLFLKVLPFGEAAARTASVFIGLLSIGLIMFLVQKLFKNKQLTALAGFLSATTPALFINSRLLLDNIYPIPFVLLWLIFLHGYLKGKKTIFLFLSGLSLGIGIHSYHAAKIMMPIYVGITLFLFFREITKGFKSLSVFVAGFTIPILLFIPWLRLHPDTLLNQVSYIGGLDSSVNVQKGFFGVFNLTRAGSFASNYLTYFSPKILFTHGDRSLIHSTGNVGAFLFPVLLLLIFGALSVFKNKDRFSRLLLLGFLTYPAAPALVNDPERISRGFVVIPFTILLSVYGAKFLLAQKDKVFHYLVVLILCVSTLQFANFLVDYFGKYRERSYSWFNNDIGGALESVLGITTARKVEEVYLDEHIPFIDLYFEFYQNKLGINMRDKWEFYDFRIQDFTKYLPGSLVLVRYDHLNAAKDKIGPFEKIQTIREPGGNETFYIYWREK